MKTDPIAYKVLNVTSVGATTLREQVAPGGYVPSELHKQLAAQSERVLEEAGRLRANVNYSRLPHRVLDPLEASWPEIESANIELLDRAGSLDATEAGLKAEDDRLGERGRTLDGITKTHDQAIHDFNRDCAGERPEDVYLQCLKRKAELEPVLRAHNEAIRQHNEEVEAFKARVRTYYEDVSGLNDTFRAWARRVIDLIDKIRAMFSASPGTMVCSWTEQRIPPENGVCIYDCFEPDGQGGWIDHPGIPIPAQTEGDPCPMRLDFVPVPPGVG